MVNAPRSLAVTSEWIYQVLFSSGSYVLEVGDTNGGYTGRFILKVKLLQMMDSPNIVFFQFL